MVTVDIIFRNGKIVTPSSIVVGGIAVDDGKIVAVASDLHLPNGDDVVDLSGNIVFPGVIDNHVHFGARARTDREDFESGTRAAALGGITTVSEMPTGEPDIMNVELLKKKREYAAKNSFIDFSLFGGAGSENLEDLHEMADAGVVAYKTFMTGSRRCSCRDDDKILKLLKAAAETGVVSCWHAENGYLIDALAEELMAAGRVDPFSYLESRPNQTEYEAVSRLIIFNRIAKARLHITHMSTKEGVALVRTAKSEGMRITADTCPHYLLLNSKHVEKMGPYAKMSPPLRSEEDRQALWRGLIEGTINFVCTDHGTATKQSKEIGWKNFWLASPATPGVETMVALMLDQVNRGTIGLQRMAYSLSTGPAQVFGMFPKKGSISLGADADLSVVDLDQEWTIKAENMSGRSKDTTSFEGWKVKGKPILTVVRGEIVSKDGLIIGKKGYGNFQKRLQ